MSDKVWLALGLVAQCLFTGRFLVQWLASEKAKRSVVPMAFWYLSISGSSLLLLYAIHKRDPVFILGQSAGFIIYIRNVVLRVREQRAAAAAAVGFGPSDDES